jgi:hypothetical protein
MKHFVVFASIETSEICASRTYVNCYHSFVFELKHDELSSTSCKYFVNLIHDIFYFHSIFIYEIIA